MRSHGRWGSPGDAPYRYRYGVARRANHPAGADPPQPRRWARRLRRPARTQPARGTVRSWLREQHRVDDVDHAVRSRHVGRDDLRLAAGGVGEEHVADLDRYGEGRSV